VQFDYTVLYERIWDTGMCSKAITAKRFTILGVLCVLLITAILFYLCAPQPHSWTIDRSIALDGVPEIFSERTYWFCIGLLVVLGCGTVITLTCLQSIRSTVLGFSRVSLSIVIVMSAILFASFFNGMDSDQLFSPVGAETRVTFGVFFDTGG
jgi:cytochrome c biogenesis protein CcdA